ncbi:sugar phosphate isomerase/epimerase [bacterium]|nr:MAG: sugar phosphate isomerase/epimerase [bacterium]
MNRLAVQMYTLRDLVKTRDGLQTALEIIHGIGYGGVQLSAVGCMDGDNPEVTPEDAKEMLDANGLVCVATHRPLKRLEERTDEEIAFHKTLGCEYVGIGGWFEDTANPASWHTLLKRLDPILDRLKEAGLTFVYHNHSHEWIKNPEDGRAFIEMLIDDPRIDILVDTYWVQHAGPDPSAFLRRLKGRVPVVHLKDKEVVAEGPTFAPVGEGNLDWDSILAACADAGTEWYVVEQDTCRRDPFDCLASSFEYLVGKGL